MTIKKEFSQIIRGSLQHFSALQSHEQELIHAALRVRRNAQAPYSHFHVGAAITCSRGTIHTGCNVERCNYTATSHAEQNAIDNMIAHWGPTKITAIAVVGGPATTELSIATSPVIQSITTPEQTVLPCGHCRQIILENCFNDAAVKIHSLTPHGDIFTTTIGDLFPMAFGPAQLGIDYHQHAQQV